MSMIRPIRRPPDQAAAASRRRSARESMRRTRIPHARSQAAGVTDRFSGWASHNAPAPGEARLAGHPCPSGAVPRSGFVHRLASGQDAEPAKRGVELAVAGEVKESRGDGGDAFAYRYCWTDSYHKAKRTEACFPRVGSVCLTVRG